MWKTSGILVLGLGAAAIGAGCHGHKDAATTPSNSGGSQIVGKVDETLCDAAGKNVVTYDLNRDGKPDVWRLFKTEDQNGTKVDVLTCKQVDFDHDGRKDWVVAYTDTGSKAFERADFDYDGRFDMSAIYDAKTGKLIEVQRDSDFDGKYDIKEEYDVNGQLTEVTRDRDGNGVPDTWEQYRNGQLVSILYDDDGDGKVDRREDAPGAAPKVDMPGLAGGTASGTVGDAGAGSGSGSGSGSAKPGAK